MIKKSFPIRKPYFYDTKEGVDHFTKLMIEENPKKLSDKEKQEIHQLGKDMKKSALDYHSKKLKKFDNLDPTTYPSDPAQRGTLMEIGKLEKDLELPLGQRKPKRNIWDEFVKNKGVMPELTAEERIRAKGPSDWDVIYSTMSPQEKGTWNAEKRREKLQKQKEFEEEKRQLRVKNHTKQQWGIQDKKLADLPIIKNNINYQKMPNQDLKNNMKKWINEADAEKEKIEVINKPTSLPGVQSILAIDVPSHRVTPEETISLDQRLRNTKVTPGLSTELVKLQKDINRNMDYVLGDRKTEIRREETPTKEELE